MDIVLYIRRLLISYYNYEKIRLYKNIGFYNSSHTLRQIDESFKQKNFCAEKNLPPTGTKSQTLREHLSETVRKNDTLEGSLLKVKDKVKIEATKLPGNSRDISLCQTHTHTIQCFKFNVIISTSSVCVCGDTRAVILIPAMNLPNCVCPGTCEIPGLALSRQSDTLQV